MKVKLVGPAACTNVSANIADRALDVTWVPPNDPTVEGFNLYAQPAGPADASVDSAQQLVCDDASSVDAADGDADCYGQYVTPPSNACGGVVDVSIACGTADAGAGGEVCTQVGGGTNVSGTINGLTNGQSYDVAVAAVDEFGNLGAVSTAACQTPEPVQDFWGTYNEQGGISCALGPAGSGHAATGALLGLVALLFFRRRPH